MQPFEIFRSGKHTAASGATVSFTEDDLRASIAAYDPAIHEAPIVVGHPKDNAPAYGWVKSLAFGEGGAMTAEPAQVDEAFAEMVASGRFKKRSASFYTPDSPSNPKPGVFYLRHVGFLGAQPPAVKGLKEVAFSEADGVVEFADSTYVASLMARFARGLRDWLIADKGLEAANAAVPDYLVSSLEDEARKPADSADPMAAATPSFKESSTMTITKEQFDAEKARADKAEADLKAAREAAERQSTDFAERERAIAEREAAAARRDVEARVDALIADGRVLPAQKKAAVDFALSLADSDATFDFGEGDKATKVTQRAHYFATLAAGPKLVEYGEKAAPEKSGAADLTAQQIAEKAVAFQESERAAGRRITTTEAVAAVRAGKA